MAASSRNRDNESGANNNNSSINYAASGSTHHGSDNKWVSWLVPVFVIANIAVFVVTMYINNCPKNNLDSKGKCFARFLGRFSFQPFQENILLGPSSNTLIKMGALEYDSFMNQHQGWRLVSCIWLHSGLLHLLANMLGLTFVGVRLEQQFGFVKIGIIYLLSGFGGSVLSSLFIGNNISVGASGAVVGLHGAMLSELITNITLYSKKKKWNFRDNSVPPPPSSTAAAVEAVPAASAVVRLTSNNNNNEAMALGTLVDILVNIVFINLVNGLSPHFDVFAHIGGFVTGFLLGFILLPRPPFGWLELQRLPGDLRLKYMYEAHQVVLCFVSVILLLTAGLLVALVMLFKVDNLYEEI